MTGVVFAQSVCNPSAVHRLAINIDGFSCGILVEFFALRQAFVSSFSALADLGLRRSQYLETLDLEKHQQFPIIEYCKGMKILGASKNRDTIAPLHTHPGAKFS